MRPAGPGWFIEAPAAEGAPAAGASIAFERLYRAFLAARAALGLALVAAQLIAHSLASALAPTTLGLSLFYAAEAVLLWLWPALRRGVSARSLARVNSVHWWSCIGLDLVLFGVLHALDGSGVNYGALFVMPVLTAGVLSPRLMALATAAMATLGLLAAAGWSILLGQDVGLRTTQAGLVGSGLFVVALLASEVAQRLAREERAARGSLAMARQQEQLNRLVIDEMQEGVLVVDQRGRVRAANPAARALLGEADALLQLRSRLAWQPLVAAVEQAHAQGGWPEAGGDVTMLSAAGSRSLRLRLRFTRRRDTQGGQGSEELCVLLLEDNRELLARSRQEKLAAMGRVSAGIAHEIRNPLAAIAQANALLAEDMAGTRHEQLTRMVGSNVQRLKRLVDDVMEVAPGQAPASLRLDAVPLVQEVCEDWVRVNELAGSDAFRLDALPAEAVVAFEPEHLRRVLVNLLDNGLRHARPGPDSVVLRLSVQAQGVELTVYSAAPAIEAEVERHLFEPFFSTRSRGSGLGLYICRELCERHGARIEYRRRSQAPAGNEFCVLMRRFET